MINFKIIFCLANLTGPLPVLCHDHIIATMADDLQVSRFLRIDARTLIL